MKLFDALGYLHGECSKIVAIRNNKKLIEYDLLDEGKTPPKFTDEDWIAEGWEIGWSCLTCESTGKQLIWINGREREVDCPECESGIYWEGEY